MAATMVSASIIRDQLKDLLDQSPSVTATPDARPAAVLVPILTATDRPRLVFTRRSDTLSRHPGEISFPGGVVDPGEKLAAAALREAEEELGLLPADVELLGALEPVHTHVTGMLIVPFVGLLWQDPRFTPNEAEIAEVLEFPLEDLSRRWALKELHFEGRSFETNLFDMDGHLIWGATARILRSFLDLVEALPARDRKEA
jgi:8-oxo-dGTP pyrophosphatase MutT (NUDIX family)